ncbi:MAG: hypothetical protein KBD76_03980 [Bacteriovorax sp.]|jgi:hypothetical protein|nr:hypothetical protein [Bacteriovorax sp.]
MKKWILALSLLFSFGSFASANLDQLTPINEGDFAISCGENEEAVQIIVGRYCIVRDPITHTCMFWENLYKEICQPKSENN